MFRKAYNATQVDKVELRTQALVIQKALNAGMPTESDAFSKLPHVLTQQAAKAKAGQGMSKDMLSSLSFVSVCLSR